VLISISSSRESKDRPLNKGLIGQYESVKVVLLVPAFTFLMGNQPADGQFWASINNT